VEQQSETTVVVNVLSELKQRKDKNFCTVLHK